uniref:Uncharacterized protein n=1 Tax=Ditylenchus dipsaci TaxID=166011 RepID=A0A915DHE7_9BILA
MYCNFNATNQLLADFDSEDGQNQSKPSANRPKKGRIMKVVVLFIIVATVLCLFGYFSFGYSDKSDKSNKKTKSKEPYQVSLELVVVEILDYGWRNSIGNAGTIGVYVPGYQPNRNRNPAPIPGQAHAQAPAPIPGQAHAQAPAPIPGQAHAQAPAPIPGQAHAQAPAPIPGQAHAQALDSVLPGSIAQSPAVSSQGQRSPPQGNAAQNPELLPLGSQNQAQLQQLHTMQSEDSQNPQNPSAAKNQHQAEVLSQDTLEKLGRLEPEHVDWTKEKKGMSSRLRKKFATEWLKTNVATRRDDLQKLADSIDIDIEPLRKWMGKNKHLVPYEFPTTLYEQIFNREEAYFQGIDFISLPNDMYNPMRRERLKFLYENDPNFSNAKAAEELGVEEATVRMWISRNKPSYNVGDKRQNRQHDNVKDSDVQQKKRLTNSLRAKPAAERVTEEEAVTILEHETTQTDVEYLRVLAHQVDSGDLSKDDFHKKVSEKIGIDLPDTPAVLESVQNRVAAEAVALFLTEDAVPEIHFGDLNMERLTVE